MAEKILYTCVKCSFQGSNLVLRSDFLYEINRKTIPIKKDVGVCYTCNKIVPVEVLPNSLNSQTKNLSNEVIGNERKRIEILKERRTPARCLRCGGFDFDTIPKSKHSRDRRIPLRTGLKHRQCGGRIYADFSNSCFHYGGTLWRKNFYDVEGNLIRKV